MKATGRTGIAGIACLMAAALAPAADAQAKPSTTPQTTIPMPTRKPAPTTAEGSQRKEVFHNDRVAAYLLEIPANQATPMQQYEKDIISVFLNGGHATSHIEGRAPKADTYITGEVRYKHGGFAETLRNDGTETLRAVVLEFTQSQGESISEELPVKRQCTEGSTRICVIEKHLFCTTQVCAEDVTMAPGATRSGFASESDQMLLAVTDYQLSDEFDGSTTSSTERASGQVEWIINGNSANRRTNAGSATARFILIRFNAEH